MYYTVAYCMCIRIIYIYINYMFFKCFSDIHTNPSILVEACPLRRTCLDITRLFPPSSLPCPSHLPRSGAMDGVEGLFQEEFRKLTLSCSWSNWPKHVESSPENEIMVYSNWDIQAVKKRNGTNWWGKQEPTLLRPGGVMFFYFFSGGVYDVPSGKHTENDGTSSPFLIGKSTKNEPFSSSQTVSHYQV